MPQSIEFLVCAVILPHPEHLAHVGKGIALDAQPNQATIILGASPRGQMQSRC